MEKFQHYLEWANEGKKSIFRYFFGALFVLAMSLIIGQVFSAFGSAIIPSDTPAARIIKTTLIGFIVSFLVIPIVIGWLHGRPWYGIAMPRPKVFWKDFLVGFSAVLIVLIISNLVSYLFFPENYAYVGADYTLWVPMFFLYIIVFFVQASVEEMVYRGYLAQMVYRLTKSPFLILLIPSIIFSFPHYGNITGLAGIWSLTPYITMGLLYAWLAYRSGSLWMAIGAHLANNWFITMFVGSKAESIEKLSLFQTSSDSVNLLKINLGALLFSILVVVVAEFMMRRWKLKRTIMA